MSAAHGSPSPAIRQAGQLDARGMHQEAIGVLSAAASQGDAAAKRLVGARILLGDRAPNLGAPGADLLTQAAAEGDGAAAAIMAVLCAAGAFRPQSWPRALEFLQRAAELGHAVSRRSMGVLAGENDEAAGRAEAGDWAGLRARIDPAWLTSAPEPRVLCEDPLVRSFPGFAPPRICAWLKERSHDRLRRAEIYNAVSQQTHADETRTNTAANFTLLDADLVQLAVQSRMAAAVGAPLGNLEAPAVLHYAEGEEFVDHFDFVDPAAPDHDLQVARDGQRVITILLYLNGGYEGGETEFPRVGLSHRGGEGEAMAFVNALPDGKADLRTLHAGRPPRGGEKWVFSQFVRSRRALPGAG